MKQGWEIKKLGEVAHISPSKSEVKTFALNPMDMVSFLPMEDLTIGRTFVHPNKQKTLSEIEGSYTYFKEGDVLLAKVTPCFENGKLAIAKGLCNNIGFGSSEYIVIRPMQHIVNSQYLIYLLQTNAFRNGGRTLMIEACGLKRLPKPYVANYELPIPSLAEQERIVEILDREFEKIDALKANAERSLQQAKDLFQSALKQELHSKDGWVSSPISEISENLDYRRVPVTKKDRKAGIYPYYGASGIVDYVDNFLFDEDLLLVSEDGANLVARSTPIAFSVSGKIWVNNHAHILRFPNIELQRYVEYFFANYDISEYVTGAAQPKFNQRALNNIVITFPIDRSEQKDVVARLDKLKENCQSLEENYKKTIALCDDMKHALLRQAFNGEL